MLETTQTIAPAATAQVETAPTATVAPTAVPTPSTFAPDPVTTSDGLSFKDRLGEDFKDTKVFDHFKDEKDLAKSHLHLNKLLGTKAEEWAKEDLAKVYTKLGRPEAPDKYEVPTELGEARTAALKEMAFKAGLSQDQMKAFTDEMVLAERARVERMETDFKNKFEASEASLKKEYGSAFEARLELAKRTADQLTTPEMKAVLKASGLDNNAEVVKFFATIGQKYLEEHSIVNADKAGKHGITPAEAKSQIDIETRANYSAYRNSNHPDHAKVKARIDQLYKQAYGTEQ